MDVEKKYWIVRAALVILTVAACLIATANEDGTTRLFVTVCFAAAQLLLSFPAERISKRMIAVGDSIRTGWKRVLYYVVLPVALGVLSLVAYYIISGDWFSNSPGTLGEGLVRVFFYILAWIAIFLPYVLTLYVLLIRKVCENGSKKQKEQTK